MLSHIHVKDNLLEDEKYQYLFSVEEVNKLVLQGVPFRDAYNQIGKQIEEGKFKYDPALHHTHEGSIGNLQNAEIKKEMNAVMKQLNAKIRKVDAALAKLSK